MSASTPGPQPVNDGDLWWPDGLDDTPNQSAEEPDLKSPRFDDSVRESERGVAPASDHRGTSESHQLARVELPEQPGELQPEPSMSQGPVSHEEVPNDMATPDWSVAEPVQNDFGHLPPVLTRGVEVTPPPSTVAQSGYAGRDEAFDGAPEPDTDSANELPDAPTLLAVDVARSGVVPEVPSVEPRSLADRLSEAIDTSFPPPSEPWDEQADPDPQPTPYPSAVVEPAVAEVSAAEVVAAQIVNAEVLSPGVQPPDEQAHSSPEQFWPVGTSSDVNASSARTSLEGLFDDATIDELFVNGFENVVATRYTGQREQLPPLDMTDEELVDLVDSWCHEFGNGLRFSPTHPRVALRLPGGYRLHAVMSVTARPVLTLRCARRRRIDLTDLSLSGFVEDDLAAFLDAAVQARFNIIVSSPTPRSRLGLLQALVHAAPEGERIITIEHTTELSLAGLSELRSGVVEMETQPVRPDRLGVSASELIIEARQMSPDRIVLADMRGPETYELLRFMTESRSGSFAGIYAESAAEAFSRVRAICAEAVPSRPQIADRVLQAGVDLIVHVEAVTDRVAEVVEVIPADPSGALGVVYGRDQRMAADWLDSRSALLARLHAAGYEPLDRMSL